MAPDTPEHFTQAASADAVRRVKPAAAGPNTFRRVGRPLLPKRSTAGFPPRPRIHSVPSAGDSKGRGLSSFSELLLLTRAVRRGRPSSLVARRTGAAGIRLIRHSLLPLRRPGRRPNPSVRGSGTVTQERYEDREPHGVASYRLSSRGVRPMLPQLGRRLPGARPTQARHDARKRLTSKACCLRHRWKTVRASRHAKAPSARFLP